VDMREPPQIQSRRRNFGEYGLVEFSEEPPVMGVDGVFSAEGDAWRTQRRLANLALAQRHLRGLYPKLRTVTTRLKKRWERLADAGASLNIVEELKRFTVDVTTLITFTTSTPSSRETASFSASSSSCFQQSIAG
jgi:cytochrome P450